MPTITLKGNQIGEALQFAEVGLTTRVEIGRVWFAATDTVTLTVAAGTFDPVTGALLGGNGAITGLTVKTAAGLVTTFGTSADGLDIDRNASKQGADFFYISETPGAGRGGAYGGLMIEKLVISDLPLSPRSTVTFDNGGGWTPGTGPVTPPPGGPTPIRGTQSDDILRGTAADDRIEGLDGNDRIDALGGNDLVFGGNGQDTLFGGAGDDTLEGGNGNDRLDGGTGNDLLRGGDGNDVLFGGAGNDRIETGPGNDLANGGDGNDLIVGGNGNEVQIGGAGADSMFGGAGNDKLLGGLGNDVLHGGAGGDVLDGGQGTDRLTGGAGGDAFVFSAGDRVTDFSRVEGDQIWFDAALGLSAADVIVTRVAAGTQITFAGAPGAMLLEGYFGGFDPGNDFKFDYVQTADFL